MLAQCNKIYFAHTLATQRKKHFRLLFGHALFQLVKSTYILASSFLPNIRSHVFPDKR